MSDPRHCHAWNDRTRPSAGIEARQQEIPIIFITAQRDEAVRSRLLEKGAVECLFKHSATRLYFKRSMSHFE